MSNAKEIADKITKAMEGAYQEEWSINRFKSEITGDDWGLIVCDGTILAEIRGALNYCGNGENAEYIIATQPKNIRVILSALADAERDRDYSHDRAMRLAGFLGDETVQQIIARAEAAEQELTDTQTANQCMIEDSIALRDRATAAEAKLAEAVKVIEPFAKAFAELREWSDIGEMNTVDDLEAAAAFLSKLEASSNAKGGKDT